MKKLFSVFNRLDIRHHATNLIEYLRPKNTYSQNCFHSDGNEQSLKDASHSAITGIYMFKAHANTLEESKTYDSYSQTVGILSNALKQFNDTTINQEQDNTLLHISMLSSSINSSLSRLAELLDMFANEKTGQKKESTTAALAQAERIRNTLYQQYDVKKSDDRLSKMVVEKLEDLDKTITTLQKSIQAL